MITVDFSIHERGLFSGRRTATAMRGELIVDDGVNDQKLVLRTRHDQLVTSAFFLGLLQPHVMGYGSYRAMNGLVDDSGLDEVSKLEWYRCCRRHFGL